MIHGRGLLKKLNNHDFFRKLVGNIKTITCSDGSTIAGEQNLSRMKLIYFITEDWYFCSHRLPLAVAAIDAKYDVAVVTHVSEHGDAIRQAGIRLIPFKISCR